MPTVSTRFQAIQALLNNCNSPLKFGTEFLPADNIYLLLGFGIEIRVADVPYEAFQVL